MEIIHELVNCHYLPKPNVVKFIHDDVLAPLSHTKTAFMLPLLPNGDLVMAMNRRRGLEFPGGHIDPGETSCQAAHRETVEETGYWVSHIRSLGYLLMLSEGKVPADWKYPHPLSFQQFYVGDVMWNTPYVENDECLAPAIVKRENAHLVLDDQRLAIYKAALSLMR